MLYPAAEVGYDVRVESVSFRPYIGAGMTWFMASTTQGSAMGDSYFVTYPGLSITYRPDNSLLFAGIDSRLVLPLAENASLSSVMSVGVHGVVGLHF